MHDEISFTMKILFINQCYWPDSAATAQILTDLAEELVLKGHEVTVICSRKSYSEQSASYPKADIHKGVTIRRIANTGLGKEAGMMGRFVDAFCYFVGTLFVTLTMRKQDVIVTLSSPPLIGIVGRISQVIRRTFHVHWCMDIFPDNGVEFGVIRRDGWAHKTCAAIASFYLKSADITAVLSKYMAARIKQYGVDDASIRIIPVWTDGRKLKPVKSEDNWFVKKYSLQNKFVVMFSGNLTYGGDIKTIIDTLAQLRSDKDIVFILISQGSRFDEFRSMSQARGLDNVLFLPFQKREELSYSLSAAHVHLITNKKGLEGIREPCKVYGILAAGRPFVLIGDPRCDAGDIAFEHDVGIVVDEGDTAKLASTIHNLKHAPGKWKQMCLAGREIFEKRYDAIYAINCFENVLLNTCKSRTSPSTILKNRHEVEREVKIAHGNKNG